MVGKAWKVLEAHAPAAHAMLLRVTLRRDVAEELLQELLVKLAGSSAFRQAADPGAYVRRSAVNLAMDWRRRQRRSRPVSAGVDVELAADASRGPAEAAEAADETERILDAAGELTELEREAFVLRYVQDEPYERVGQILGGRTAHQARGLCHAAVRRVRETLAERRVSRE